MLQVLTCSSLQWITITIIDVRNINEYIAKLNFTEIIVSKNLIKQKKKKKKKT